MISAMASAAAIESAIHVIITAFILSLSQQQRGHQEVKLGQ